MSMRISGLASGMDIDYLVKNMMNAEQMKIDKLMREKVRSQWTQEAFNNVNASLARFILDRNNDLGARMNAVSSTINLFGSNITWLKSAVSSDTKVAAVAAGASAIDGSVKIKVEQLADNWAAASTVDLPEFGSSNNLASQFGLEDGALVDFTITTNKGAIRITSDQNAEATKGVKLVKINLKTTALSEIATQLNQADIGLQANYDGGIRRFFLQTSASGSFNTITIQDNSTGLGDGVAGFMAAANSEGTSLLQMKGNFGQVVSAAAYAGIDALLDIGAAKGIIQSSNEFNINGINYSLKNVGEATIQVSTDVKNAFDKIKTFVDEYNKLIDDLNVQIREKPDKGFQPLTDEEKKAMSEDQIKNWEEKARAGLLHNNSEISRMLTTMRTNIFAEVSGVKSEYNSLFKIGITTQAYSASSGGRLIIDEGRLKDALQKDAASVMELLFKSPDTSIEDKNEQIRQTGVINRMYGDIVGGMKSIINKAGAGNNTTLYRSVQTTMILDFITVHGGISTIDRDISTYEKRIYEMNQRFISIQNRYYSQFDAMEKAIRLANSQSEWLSMQLSGMIG